MDDENNGKPLFLMDDLGVPPIFGNTHIIIQLYKSPTLFDTWVMVSHGSGFAPLRNWVLYLISRKKQKGHGRCLGRVLAMFGESLGIDLDGVVSSKWVIFVDVVYQQMRKRPLEM